MSEYEKSKRKALRKGDRVRGGKGVHGTVVRWNAYLQCFVVQWDHYGGQQSYARRKTLRALPHRQGSRSKSKKKGAKR